MATTYVDDNSATWVVTEIETSNFVAESTIYSPPGRVYATSLSATTKKIDDYAKTHSVPGSIFSSLGLYLDENGKTWFRTDRVKDAASKYPPEIPPLGPRLRADTISGGAGYSPAGSVLANNNEDLKSAIDAFAKAHKAAPAPSEPEVVTVTPDLAARIRAASAVVRAASPFDGDGSRQAQVAIGRFENDFGMGPGWIVVLPVPVPGGGTVTHPSYNWGATVARAGDPYIERVMKNPVTGATEKRRFATFSDMAAGYRRFREIWGKPDTLAAAQRGDADAIAAAMFAHRYYEPTGSEPASASIDRYARAIMANAIAVAKVLGEPIHLYRESEGSSDEGPDGGGGGGGGGGKPLAKTGGGGAGLFLAALVGFFVWRARGK